MYIVEGERSIYKSSSVEGKIAAQASWQLLASGNMNLHCKPGRTEGGGGRRRAEVVFRKLDFQRGLEAEREGKTENQSRRGVFPDQR